MGGSIYWGKNKNKERESNNPSMTRGIVGVGQATYTEDVPRIEVSDSWAHSSYLVSNAQQLHFFTSVSVSIAWHMSPTDSTPTFSVFFLPVH